MADDGPRKGLIHRSGAGSYTEVGQGSEAGRQGLGMGEGAGKLGVLRYTWQLRKLEWGGGGDRLVAGMLEASWFREGRGEGENGPRLGGWDAS